MTTGNVELWSPLIGGGMLASNIYGGRPSSKSSKKFLLLDADGYALLDADGYILTVKG